MALDIKVDSAKLQRLLKAAPQELDRAMIATAARIGDRYIGFHRARKLRGPPGVRGTRGQPGRPGLLTAFKRSVEGTTLNRLKLEIGTRSRVALEHEESRLIQPKSGKYLLVPLQIRGKEMTRAQIKTARAKLQAGLLFPFKTKTGQNLLAERTSKKGRPRFVFALVPRVKLGAFPIDFRDLWKSFIPTAIKIFNGGLGQALRAARRKSGAS